MDDNFVLSPAALWSCLIVFLLDPPPENFEQLTSGKHLLDRWLKFTFFLNFKTQAKTNKIPAKKEGSCALRSINSPLWCEMMKKLPKELRKIKVYQ